MYIHEADNDEIQENKHLKHVTENWTHYMYRGPQLLWYTLRPDLFRALTLML